MAIQRVIELWTVDHADVDDPSDVWQSRWALVSEPDGFVWLAALPGENGGTEWVEIEDGSAATVDEARVKMRAIFDSWPNVKSVEVKAFNAGKEEGG